MSMRDSTHELRAKWHHGRHVVININPTRDEEGIALPSKAACTLRFKLCVAERFRAVAAALGGPPAEDEGFVPLMLRC